MDSSWRNKNALRCPVTILSTVNEYHRMVPGLFSCFRVVCAHHCQAVAVMVSQHADTDAYQFLLDSLCSAIHKHVEALLSGEALSRYPTRYHEKLLDLCEKVREDEYFPQFMMIDGDDAERLAIERVFPGLPFRLCQFHFMQACRSKARSAFGRSQTGEAKTAAFLKALRRCQRCPVESDWSTYHQRLQQEIDDIAQDGGDASAMLSEYFKRVWFSDRWRPHCIDYGIPSHLTRDGPWSTNNYAEAAFRTFDRVFLSCRVNKRSVQSLFVALLLLISSALTVCWSLSSQHTSHSMKTTQMTSHALILFWSISSSMGCPYGNQTGFGHAPSVQYRMLCTNWIRHIMPCPHGQDLFRISVGIAKRINDSTAAANTFRRPENVVQGCGHWPPWSCVARSLNLSLSVLHLEPMLRESHQSTIPW